MNSATIFIDICTWSIDGVVHRWGVNILKINGFLEKVFAENLKKKNFKKRKNLLAYKEVG